MNIQKASRDSRNIRSGQLITTYAPGSIFTTLAGESFVITTIDVWENYLRGGGRIIELERLANSLTESMSLEINHFLSPLSEDSNQQENSDSIGIPGLRFPRWLRCNTCMYMKHWQHADEQSLEPFQLPQCKRMVKKDDEEVVCGGLLAPVSYVIACKGGHMQDLDWPSLVHQNNKNCRKTDGLFWVKKRKGGPVGLKSEIVRCAHCYKEKDSEEKDSEEENPEEENLEEENLEEENPEEEKPEEGKPEEGKRPGEAVMEDVYKIPFRCHVKQPWESRDQSKIPTEHCNKARVAQRAAMNLHSPSVVRALDIPPDAFRESNPITTSPNFINLVQMVKNAGCTAAQLMEKNDDFEDEIEDVALDVEENTDLILNLVDQEANRDSSTKSLILGEYEALLEARQPYSSCKNPRFVVRKQELDQSRPAFSNFDQLRIVERLRQVSAVTHFRRLGGGAKSKPEEDPPSLVEVDLGVEREKWLPATEAYGEGIFMTFSEEKLKSWWAEKGVSVKDRFDQYRPPNHEDLIPFREAKFRIIHTFSHLLIRELSHRCGYAVPALSERLYVDGTSLEMESMEFGEEEQIQKMSGLLIYTTSGDLDGSMGGLVREGQPDRLESVINQALENARWCSSDPICSGKQQGVRGSNVSACHSCVLLPEGSCTNFNGQLDRQLLIDDDIGFFSGTA